MWIEVFQNVSNGLGIWKNLRFGEITSNDYDKFVRVYKQNFRYIYIYIYCNKQNLYLLIHKSIGTTATGPAGPLPLALSNKNRKREFVQKYFDENVQLIITENRNYYSFETDIRFIENDNGNQLTTTI